MQARKRNTPDDVRKQSDTFAEVDAARADNLGVLGLKIMFEEATQRADLKAYRRLRRISGQIVDGAGSLSLKRGKPLVSGASEEDHAAQWKEPPEPTDLDAFYNDTLLAVESLVDRAEAGDDAALERLRDFADHAVRTAASFLPTEAF